MLINELERIFLSNADEFHAKRKTAYMRHLFPFIGLSTPLRKTLQKPLYKTHAIQDEQAFKGRYLVIYGIKINVNFNMQPWILHHRFGN